MTQLATIFAKPIDRHIEGVIKADDDASLRQEVEEYVLTNEVAKRLDSFLAAYNDYQGANGVWISGFFGSGKSHLLKILAMLLENRVIDGMNVLDLFLSKCKDDFQKAELKRAVGIPSRSILFNIDQKADVISKKQMDALLAVFAKVFDEMCGYYGKQGHIAQFERDLDSRGQYAAFKDAFAQIAGLSWEAGREQALLEGYNIAVAYAQATGAAENEAKGILDKYRQQYKLSIEDFAEQVNAFIDQQEPNFRLNFFVDEVGQYIADNIKLMTNLQTVAESLATKCQGRAWIIVTAQDDMSDIFGEANKQQSNDFTKIQARFKNRMKLTSADVSEVIRKRLLTKNETGDQQLKVIHDQQQNNFKTLFDFADGAQTYRNFRTRDEFIDSYPFITYQFTLFQSAIQNLSLHNAFEGKYSSVGERSMLGVFQQVALQIANHQIGELATFDLMYEGIRTTLKANVQKAVNVAEANLTNKFAVQVLKALLLVKYVREFKATVRNLTVLMLPHFNADLPTLKRKLEEALNLLEQQTYIQRNGELYEYLTDEEKDVEVEIKATEVDTSAVVDELGKLIFENIIRDRKIRYEENDQDYPFSRKLDEHILSREYELAIHVITPFHDQFDNETVLRAHALGRDELLVILPPNDRLVRDLRLYKQTDKYVTQNISLTQQESVRRILQDKLHQNQERLAGLKQMVQELLGQAKLIAAGHDLEISSSDPKTRIVQGFHDLIQRTYPNLRMLRGVTYRQEDIPTYLHPANTLLADADATFSEAEKEVFNFVNSNYRNNLRTSLQALDQRFERKPYGWYLAAIQCVVAKLCARGKIEVRQDSTLLEDTQLERAISNTHGYSNILLTPQEEYSAAQIRGLRDFYAEFFDGPPYANEAKMLGQETGQAFRELAQNLVTLRQQGSQYPFLTALDEPIQKVQTHVGHAYTYYLTELRPNEDELLALKEKVIEPIRRFMSGAQKEIYDDIRRFLRDNEANFSYVESDTYQMLHKVLADPYCFQGNKIQQARRLLNELQTAVFSRVQQEKDTTLAKVDERWERLTGMAEFGDLAPDQQAQLQRAFTNLKQRINQQTVIAIIRDLLRRFDETEYNNLLHQMTVWAVVPDDIYTKGADTAGSGMFAEPRPQLEIVSLRALQVEFKKALLTDTNDVDTYLAVLRQTLVQAIQDGKRIQI